MLVSSTSTHLPLFSLLSLLCPLDQHFSARLSPSFSPSPAAGGSSVTPYIRPNHLYLGAHSLRSGRPLITSSPLARLGCISSFSIPQHSLHHHHEVSHLRERPRGRVVLGHCKRTPSQYAEIGRCSRIHRLTANRCQARRHHRGCLRYSISRQCYCVRR